MTPSNFHRINLQSNLTITIIQRGSRLKFLVCSGASIRLLIEKSRIFQLESTLCPINTIYEGLYAVKRKIAELEKVHRENIFEFTCVSISCCAEIDLPRSFGPRRVSTRFGAGSGGRLGAQGTFFKKFFSGGLNRCKCLSTKYLPPPRTQKAKNGFRAFERRFSP